MPTTTFPAVVALGGKTATGIRVPPEIVAGLSCTRRPAVRVTIGDHTYRTTVAVMGGDFMIPLSGENRSRAGVAAGDRVDALSYSRSGGCDGIEEAKTQPRGSDASPRSERVRAVATLREVRAGAEMCSGSPRRARRWCGDAPSDHL